MFHWYRRWKQKKAIRKVKPGDGHALKPYRWWQIFTRSLFYIRLTEEDGEQHIYAVSVPYFSEDVKADLYRDDKHDATSKLPAKFPVPGGLIDVFNEPVNTL